MAQNDSGKACSKTSRGPSKVLVKEGVLLLAAARTLQAGVLPTALHWAPTGSPTLP